MSLRDLRLLRDLIGVDRRAEVVVEIARVDRQAAVAARRQEGAPHPAEVPKEEIEALAGSVPAPPRPGLGVGGKGVSHEGASPRD